MKLFLHVGPHKTGTTLIQKTLLDNQQKLLDGGLFYPKQFMLIFGHHKFREKIVSRTITDDDVNFLKASERDVILSSEDFISLNETDFKYFLERLKDFEIKIIYTWRRASKKLYSIWQEVVKHGGSASFLSYHSPHLANPAASAMLSADVKLMMFSRIFGKNSLHIIDYEASVKHTNLLLQFLEIVGYTKSNELCVPDNDKNAKNISMPFTDIEIIRALNRLFSLRHNIIGSKVRNEFVSSTLIEDAVNELTKGMSAFGFDFSINNLFVDRRTEKIVVDEFSDQLANYAIPDPSKPIRLVDSDWLLEPALRENLENIYYTLKDQIC